MQNKRKKIEERVHLLLSIKAKGQLIAFDHLFKKVSRNAGGVPEAEVRNALKQLEQKSYVKPVDERWHITEKGQENAVSLINDQELNLSYRRVLTARRYYLTMASTMIQYLRNHQLAVIKLFSNDNDPIHKVKKIFSRFSKRKPSKPHRIEDRETLINYVNMHTIDFLLIINEKDEKPESLAFSISSPSEQMPTSFLKKVVKMTNKILQEHDLTPLIIFSGDNGFNIFCKFTKPLGNWRTYQKAVKTIKEKVRKRLQSQGKLEYPLSTSSETKKEPEKGVLFSSESMKPNGTIRAPFSLHWRTGLVAIPVQLEQIDDFEKQMADPETIIHNKRDYRVHELKPKPPTKFAKELGIGLYQFLSQEEEEPS